MELHLLATSDAQYQIFKRQVREFEVRLTGSWAWMDWSCGWERIPASRRYSSSVRMLLRERLTCAVSGILEMMLGIFEVSVWKTSGFCYESDNSTLGVDVINLGDVSVQIYSHQASYPYEIGTLPSPVQPKFRKLTLHNHAPKFNYLNPTSCLVACCCASIGTSRPRSFVNLRKDLNAMYRQTTKIPISEKNSAVFRSQSHWADD